MVMTPALLGTLTGTEIALLLGGLVGEATTQQIANLSANLMRREVDASIALDATYNGVFIAANSPSGITLTLPDTLPLGFNCAVVQIGAGQATMVPAGIATLNSQQGFTKTAGLWAVIGIVAPLPATFVLTGNGA
jgi:hypothetical protein